MSNKEKVQAVLQGGGKHTAQDLALITGVPEYEANQYANQMKGIAFKDQEYYIPQHNFSGLVAFGAVLITCMIYVGVTL